MDYKSKYIASEIDANWREATQEEKDAFEKRARRKNETRWT